MAYILEEIALVIFMLTVCQNFQKIREKKKKSTKCSKNAKKRTCVETKRRKSILYVSVCLSVCCLSACLSVCLSVGCKKGVLANVSLREICTNEPAAKRRNKEDEMKEQTKEEE